MSDILQGILSKLGLKSYDQLTKEERETFARWGEALGKEPITIDNLKKFVTAELDRMSREQNNYDNDPQKDLYLKAAHRNLLFLKHLIFTPEKERERATAEIKRRFNIDI